MKISQNTYASDAGHWYDASGKPCYTLKGANGNERNTTLRDARKLGLFPSVTTITKCAAAPGLVNWMVDQAIFAALTLPRNPNEPEDAYLARIKQDSKEQARKAAEKGTQIHGAIEKHFQGVPCDAEFWPHIQAVKENLLAWFGEVQWEAEKSFAHPMGYGGKCDLHSLSSRIVVDFKGKDFSDPAECKQYDEHLMQGAAYLEGFGIREGGRFANCFISRTKPGLACIVEAESEEILRGWRMFKNLHAYWCEQSRYMPMTPMVAA